MFTDKQIIPITINQLSQPVIQQSSKVLNFLSDLSQTQESQFRWSLPTNQT
jgi:hypothetical protein